MVRFGICKCFFRQNIFVKEWKAHVSYSDRKQFLSDYASRNPSESVLAAVEAEVARRNGLQDQRVSSRAKFKEEYAPKHVELYDLKSENLNSAFGDPGAVDDRGQDVFSFPVFTETFCAMFVKELRNIESSGLPMSRPNSMNKSGV
jgi:hypothetical protein